MNAANSIAHNLFKLRSLGIIFIFKLHIFQYVQHFLKKSTTLDILNKYIDIFYNRIN